MTQLSKRLVSVIFVAFFLLSCGTVPITGRRQLVLVPSDLVLSMSFDQYKKFLSEHKVVADTDAARMVKRSGERIQRAVEEYMTAQNLTKQLQGYEWEFNLVEDNAVNAFCMPGGKVVVYTGILPVVKDESGLAVVMGHEIAHAVAKHGDERMSQGLLTQMGGLALAVALSDKPQETQRLFMGAYGMGATVGVLLPYSRLHEYEADRLGLIFMAMAGYEPRSAVEFWQRMASLKKGARPPEFLSTHPADDKRIKNLESLQPEAMKYYKKR